tara:strand:- start:1803 stop:2465 length:663 start_codon:yes stop_codon:yes gene_type:complete
MIITYAICVCNESRELYSLISFLKKVKDEDDEINILVDSLHVSNQVKSVLEYFKNDIVKNERDFDGKFATHRNYHFSLCKGDYIFYIDPDEMPQETLIKNLKSIIASESPDLIYIPRINIMPGLTHNLFERMKLPMNEMGWINWPDYNGRIFKNIESIKMESELHERFKGADKIIRLEAKPSIALWHIKSVEKQENRWEEIDDDWKYSMPTTRNLYDSLM